MKKILFLYTAIALLTVNAWADTVTFKSGKKVEGNIKAKTNNSVTVDLYGVTEMTYDLADIQEINGQPVELKPDATDPATPSETAVNPPVETSPAAPETSAPDAKTVDTSPVTNEIFRGVKGPVMENAEEAPVTESVVTTPTSEAREEIIPDKESKVVLAAVIMAFLGVIIIVCLIFYIYSAICLQVIAGKTDTQNGWMAWIPVANLFLACNIGNVRYLWLLLLLTGFVPIAGAFLAPVCDLFLFGFIWYRIALARGKEGWIGAITIIPVVGLFTMGYLAFSKKEGAAPAPNIGGGQPANQLGTAPTYKPPLE